MTHGSASCESLDGDDVKLFKVMSLESVGCGIGTSSTGLTRTLELLTMPIGVSRARATPTFVGSESRRTVALDF